MKQTECIQIRTKCSSLDFKPGLVASGRGIAMFFFSLY
jgi:hypothetical protein